jgi:hypothetical protein
MGHAFGLGDEYFAAGGADESDPGDKLEPNLSRHADPGRAPWARFWNDRTGAPWFQPPGSAATLDAQGAAGVDLFAGRERFGDAIGTFQGGRYDAARYFRPAFDCKMRNTNVGFCHCCQEVIREGILARAPL